MLQPTCCNFEIINKNLCGKNRVCGGNAEITAINPYPANVENMVSS